MTKTILKIPLTDWSWIFLLSLWRLFVSSRHGLGVDEAHYVLYGIHLDLSYFDHPPLIGWIEGIFLILFGKSEWAARLPAIICGIVSSLLFFPSRVALLSERENCTLGYGHS